MHRPPVSDAYNPIDAKEKPLTVTDLRMIGRRVALEIFLLAAIVAIGNLFSPDAIPPAWPNHQVRLPFLIGNRSAEPMGSTSEVLNKETQCRNFSAPSPYA
jgi:hypothetical protein